MAVTTNSLMALAMASMHSMKSEQPAAPADAAPAAAGALGTRTAEDEAFLLANYPKCLEDVTEKWLGLLLRAEVTGKSIKVKLEAGTWHAYLRHFTTNTCTRTHSEHKHHTDK